MKNFKPALIRSIISNDLLNPGEILWVTLYWQNTSGPARHDHRFFLDAELGHQRRIENKQCYFRIHTEAMPATSRWGINDVVAVTFRWEIQSNWSGTFHLKTGILDENGSVIEFTGEDEKSTFSQYIGSIDLSWNLGRPWVFENTRLVEKVYNKELPVQDQKKRTGPVLHGEIDVEVDEAIPAVLSVSTGKEKYILSGEAPRISIWNPVTGVKHTDGVSGCKVEYANICKNENTACYKGVMYINDEAASEFEILFKLDNRIISISALNIVEYNDWEFLSVKYDRFFELSEGYLLDFFGSGRLVPINDATPAFFEKKYDVRNAAVLYDDKIMAIVESTHIDSYISTGITNVNGRNKGFTGGSIITKIPASKGFPGIPVKQPPVFTVEVPAIDDPPDWQSAARLLRRGVKSNIYHDLYRNCHLYKQLVTWGMLPDDKYRMDPYQTTQNLFITRTFDDVSDDVRKFNNLTDGTRQVVYVGGWIEGGFDNTDPWPKGAEERCGGTQKLRDCLEECRKYNAYSGMHDNFDDINTGFAQESPYVALDENNELWRGWIWASGQSYITGYRKYVQSGAAKQRVEQLAKLFPLKDTYHIDVLTAETCRYDFDPEYPASAQDNYDAKMQVVDYFNKLDIDITSELLTHPGVGKIGFALHSRLDTKETFIPGDRFVPLVQMIYHGFIGYCCNNNTRRDVLWALLLGGQSFIEVDTAGDHSVGMFYIQGIPAMHLYGRHMTGFSFNGNKNPFDKYDVIRADYENDSYVEVDFDKEQYTVIVNGEAIGLNFTTLSKSTTSDCYLAYSLDGGKVDYPLPEWFYGKDLTAVYLTPNGEGDEIDCYTIANSIITLDLPAMKPVKIKPVD